MIENKRYNIIKSKIIENAFNIQDNKRKYSFPSTKDASTLIIYEKALNEQDERIKELEKEKEQLRNKLELYEHYVTFTTIDDDGDVLEELIEGMEVGESRLEELFLLLKILLLFILFAFPSMANSSFFLILKVFICFEF